MIRLLIVDDHPVVRDGLRGMLAGEAGFEVVAEASSGVEAIRLTELEQPDVVLMDLQMPEIDGATATAEIAARFPGSKVLVLTTYDTDADILRAVEAGATGYLLKDTPRERLFPAIRSAARGETVLAPTVATRLVSRMRAPAERRSRPARSRCCNWCPRGRATPTSRPTCSSARPRSRPTCSTCSPSSASTTAPPPWWRPWNAGSSPSPAAPVERNLTSAARLHQALPVGRDGKDPA
jgi:DNA-binding NarL/FixJ family response regulator